LSKFIEPASESLHVPEQKDKANRKKMGSMYVSRYGGGNVCVHGTGDTPGKVAGHLSAMTLKESTAPPQSVGGNNRQVE